MGHRLREPDFDDSNQPGYQRRLTDSRRGVYVDSHS
jgi:hypothetical protein